jgi:U5 small nuclear ribonucleoprotein component
MDEDLYDEFGNYIGPELDDSDEEDEYDFPDDRADETTTGPCTLPCQVATG